VCSIGFCVGNISILSNGQPEKSSQKATRSHDVSESHFELRPHWLPDRSNYC